MMNGAVPDESFFVDGYSPPEPGSGLPRTLDAAQIAEPLPDIPYLVPALGIPLGGSAPHIVGGYGFGGKTMAMMQSCLAVASGRDWWGVHRCQEGTAVFFDREQGERLTRLRFQRLARGMGIHLPDLGNRLRLVSMPEFSLATPTTELLLQEMLPDVTMAVFDSFRAFMPGMDENESRAREPLDMLGRVSGRTGTAMFPILHARKPQPGESATGRYMLRGSSGLFDVADTVIILAAADKGDPTSVCQVKARTHGELAEDFALRIEDVCDESGNDSRWGLRITALGAEAVADAKAQRAAASSARTHDRMRPLILARIGNAEAMGRPITSLRDLASSLGARATVVQAALQALLESGEVSKKSHRSGYSVKVEKHERDA
jgi:hypothetical protein